MAGSSGPATRLPGSPKAPLSGAPAFAPMVGEVVWCSRGPRASAKSKCPVVPSRIGISQAPDHVRRPTARMNQVMIHC